MENLTEEEIKRHIKLSNSGEISKAVIFDLKIKEVKEAVLEISHDSKFTLRFRLANLDPEFRYVIFTHINKSEEPQSTVFEHIIEPFDKNIMVEESGDFTAEGLMKFPTDNLSEGNYFLTLTLAKVLSVVEVKEANDEKFNGLIQDSKKLTFEVKEK
ncbi:hypothetical protein [Lactococcus cremoris]|uniref:hypothetical protein n=1 Tax=Lactococcus lactis subsp. cremoris TaxID=1359 RepID=UPI0019646F7E|nr:hypothetical protein [Lactococcus cremoris]QRZ32233.1 hypothetical protein LLW34_1076 [Lactococcus cremoris]